VSFDWLGIVDRSEGQGLRECDEIRARRQATDAKTYAGQLKASLSLSGTAIKWRGLFVLHLFAEGRLGARGQARGREMPSNHRADLTSSRKCNFPFG
jgi:hypothetical protein